MGRTKDWTGLDNTEKRPKKYIPSNVINRQFGFTKSAGLWFGDIETMAQKHTPQMLLPHEHPSHE